MLEASVDKNYYISSSIAQVKTNIILIDYTHLFMT